MRSDIARVIYEIGAKKRNPSLFSQYELLKASEWESRERLEQIQLTNAQKFLTFAKDNSPFYKGHFDRYGFNPNNLSSMSDLSVLPEITKDELIKENSKIHSENITEPCIVAETSGTSGNALQFSRNESWDSLNRATVMRSYDWYGVKPWDRNGYLWGYNISKSQKQKIRILDALQNRFRIFNYSERDVRKFADKVLDAEFISGYSSMIYEVGKIINSLDIPAPRLKLVKGTSETILDIYHSVSERAFGAKVTSEYGAAEAGLIAFECPAGSMHINVENLYLELNERSEVIVTNLVSYSFPIIRYNLGDVAAIDWDKSCACGRHHPVILDLVGRKGANVIGSEHTYPGLTFYYVFKNLALSKGVLINYKAVQSSPGMVEIFIEGGGNRRHETDVMAELYKYFADDVEFKIIYQDKFDMERKKTQYFVSNINF